MIYQPESRDKGHASSLLKQLYEVAAQHDCKAVYLDSGHIYEVT
jgi:N-acetylglutamate synthase-like GNAT family acetyltransferase